MGARIRLYSTPISHYCVAAERMLSLKQIDFEIVRVPYHDKRELLARTGQDYVPALTRGRTIVTWKELPAFLDRERPDPPLFPPGEEGEAALLQNWAHQVLEDRVWRAVVTRIGTTLTDEVERWVLEEMLSRGRGPWDVLEAREDEFRRDMDEHLAMVERLLEGREWILRRPSVADCAIFGALSPLITSGGSIPGRFVRLRRWHRRVAALGR